jgi:hypothetical protein
MAREHGSQEAIEAYQMGYRTLSPWTHAQDASFRPNFATGIYEADKSAHEHPAEVQYVRLIVVSLMAWIFETAGRMLPDDELARDARAVLDESLASGQL